MGLEAVLVSVNEGMSCRAINYLGELDMGSRAPKQFGPTFLIPWFWGRHSRGAVGSLLLSAPTRPIHVSRQVPVWLAM